ncbi:FkbM family methyltransferase [Boseongicola sp. H5]|uniref:FkbM family methyltransferase n=1 Tax=Boseongicola sp. H5 TaxID=2763261 RepID=UPI001D09D60C|nr:FkbM family methyltransferase [Boseongicola sp. H5]
MSDIVTMIAEDLRPSGTAEAWFSALARLPGGIGAVGYRKLKRRQQRLAEARLEALSAALGPGDIALDLGANVGDVTDLLAQGGATVHAFEPEPETFALLSARFADQPNVHPHNAAVSDYDGTAALVLPGSYRVSPRSASKAASIVHDRYRDGDHVETETRVIDIAGFVRDLPRRPSLIKIDIEGAEWKVLAALQAAELLSDGVCVFVETHERLDPSTLPLVRRQQAWAARQTDVYVNLYWG